MSEQASRVPALIRGVRMELGQDRGHGVVAELSDGQIVYSIRRALALYSRYFPIRSPQSFEAMPGETVYTPDPPIRGILEMDLLDKNEGEIMFPETGLFGGSFLYNNYGGGGGYDYSMPRQYANYVQWKNAADRVFSTKPGWTFEDGKLYIYSPSRIVMVSLVGAVEYDPGFDEEAMWNEEELEGSPGDFAPSSVEYTRLSAALKDVPKAHMVWLRDLALAHAMKILARMRRKWSVPSTAGRDVTLDGDALTQEGKELWNETRDSMMNAAPGYEPIFG